MAALLEHFGYVAIFGLLAAAGTGLPLPEEAVQIGAGVLAHQGVFTLWKAMVAAWVGILAGDSLIYAISRRHGERALSSGIGRRVLTPERREKLRSHFERHAFGTIVVARHLSGFRVAAFVLAGAHRVPFRTVLLADALSAAASVPFAVGIGYLFSQHVLQLERGVRAVRIAILAVAAVVAVALVLRGTPAAARSTSGGTGASAATARKVLAAFLATFLAARTIVYLIMSRRIPDLAFHTHRTHVHHLDFGIFLLALVGAALLFLPESSSIRRRAATAYGIGLALTFDEFGMWLHLGGGYWQRASFDAMVAIAAALALATVTPVFGVFRRRHWIAAAAFALALVVFGYLLVDSARFAENRWFPSLQGLDVAPPP